MRSAHLAVVSQLKLPAFLFARGMTPFVNAAARAIWGDSLDMRVIEARCAQIAGTGEAGKHEMNGFDFLLLPIFSAFTGVEAVAAIHCTEPEAPQILSRFYNATGRYTTLLNGLPHIVFTARPNGEIDYLNRQWSEVFGTSANAGAAKLVLFGTMATDVRAFAAGWRDGIASGRRFSMIAALRTRDGQRRFALNASPIESDGAVTKWVGTLEDVEDAVSANETLAASERWFETLAAAGEVLASAVTIAAVLAGLAGLRPIVPGATLYVEIHDPESDRALTRPATTPEIRRGIGMALAGMSAGADAMDKGGFIAVDLPLPERGFIALRLPPTPQRIAINAERLLREIARRLVEAAVRIRASERSERIAGALQRSMLPLAFPQFPGLAFDVAYEPAERDALVGGDWYDAIELGDGRVAIAMGDVAGHGIPAAIVMSRLRQAMRASALENLDAALVLERANRIIDDLDVPLVTAFFGVVDTLRMEISYANAGHLPPLVVDATGVTQTLEAHGPPLGVVDSLTLPLAVASLPPGGALVLYTDGVVENERDLRGGQREFEILVAQWAIGGFRERIATLQHGMLTGPQNDDAATFALRFPEDDELALEIASSPLNASRMRTAVERFVAKAQLPESRRFEAALAIAEAINNASEHAYRRSGGTIAIRLRRESRALVASISDRGNWKPKIESDRGRGIFLMEALADEVKIATDGVGTSVELRFDYEDHAERDRTDVSKAMSQITR